MKNFILKGALLASGAIAAYAIANRKGINQLFKKKKKKGKRREEEIRPDDGFRCRLTGKLMEDPVISPDGIAFERWAIEGWLETNNQCPVTEK